MGLQMQRSLSHVSFSICSDLRRRQIDLLRKHRGGSVDLEVNEKTGIALMTLNNPKKKNAITGSMHLEFEERIEELEKWETGKGLIVKGCGNTFCSGGDLNFVRALAKEKDSDNPSLMSSFMQNATTRLSNLPLITVALVEGFAVGGGAELMTCCDFRVVHSSARIGFLEAQMGLSTGWGGSVRLVHLLGRSKALQLLTSARVISGIDAQKIGLADEIFGESDDPLEATTSFLTKYLKFPSEVIKAMKRVAVNASKSDSKSVEHLNAKETDIFQNLCGGPANLAALNRK
ncbi:hypothetical protein HELRODRAFT_159708 [Helobdella robusta]|uniref:Ethylmalonyl-CoA decarboxylase n=1 Tax=Helobdella robusta TaxID=6412 RepID=T1EPC0_HELRO|nr:hypothetical protein HELRODRAFT_159708 [Helobdella robusta]ESO13101.1 hypothetical protein HELRODRAFT_159708 [Helobdella robusta]